MAHNFRKQNTQAYSRPVLYIAKSGADTNDGLTPETAVANPAKAAEIASAPSAGGSPPWQPYFLIDGAHTAYIGTGNYQGEILYGFSHNLIADGKVIWNVNGKLRLATKSDQLSPCLVEGISFRFVSDWSIGMTGGGFNSPKGHTFSKCVFSFLSNADINTRTLGDGGSSFYVNNSIFTRLHAPDLHYQNCYLFNSKALNAWFFVGCYADANSFVELRDVAMFTNGRFANVNIQGQIRVINDTYGYTDLATFKQNYGLQSRLDIVSRDPRFNKPTSEDYTLKLDSPHLDLQIGPSHLRYTLMYYVDSTVSPGEPCTIGNTRLKSTADNSLIQFKDIGGFTINSSGGLVIIPNSQGNFEGYYTTSRIPLSATNQRVKLVPVITGLNFDSDFPATAAAFSSVTPEVFNNNVPDYSNSISNGGRTPNRLTVQARFSTLANPDEATNEHWTPNNGQFLDFEIDEEPFFDAVTGYGSGHPLFNPQSVNVRPVLARFMQVRYKSRNDYYSK